MAKKRDKFEVVDFASSIGGWFVHGGNLGETYFKNKVDADQVCAALNMMERLKLKSTQHKITMLGEQIRVLSEALENGTEYEY